MNWRRQRARGSRRAVEDTPGGQRRVNDFGAGLGGDLGAGDGLVHQPVDCVHHRLGFGEVLRLQMRRQRVNALAGLPRAHE
ncbi:MAG: hypothetical protein WCG92_13105 [Hyphomicrobiales bacterium]